MIQPLTQVQKILVNLAYSRKEWNKAHDLIGSGDTFIGYEVSARLTNAKQTYPELIESQPNGKYKEVRLRIEDAKEWLPTLHKDLRDRIEEGLKASGKNYQKTITRYERTERGTMRRIDEIINL